MSVSNENNFVLVGTEDEVCERINSLTSKFNVNKVNKCTGNNCNVINSNFSGAILQCGDSTYSSSGDSTVSLSQDDILLTNRATLCDTRNGSCVTLNDNCVNEKNPSIECTVPRNVEPLNHPLFHNTFRGAKLLNTNAWSEVSYDHQEIQKRSVCNKLDQNTCISGRCFWDSSSSICKALGNPSGQDLPLLKIERNADNITKIERTLTQNRDDEGTFVHIYNKDGDLCKSCLPNQECQNKGKKCGENAMLHMRNFSNSSDWELTIKDRLVIHTQKARDVVNLKLENVQDFKDTCVYNRDYDHDRDTSSNWGINRTNDGTFSVLDPNKPAAKIRTQENIKEFKLKTSNQKNVDEVIVKNAGTHDVCKRCSHVGNWSTEDYNEFPCQDGDRPCEEVMDVHIHQKQGEPNEINGLNVVFDGSSSSTELLNFEARNKHKQPLCEYNHWDRYETCYEYGGNSSGREAFWKIRPEWNLFRNQTVKYNGKPFYPFYMPVENMKQNSDGGYEDMKVATLHLKNRNRKPPQIEYLETKTNTGEAIKYKTEYGFPTKAVIKNSATQEVCNTCTMSCPEGDCSNLHKRTVQQLTCKKNSKCARDVDIYFTEMYPQTTQQDFYSIDNHLKVKLSDEQKSRGLVPFVSTGDGTESCYS